MNEQNQEKKMISRFVDHYSESGQGIEYTGVCGSERAYLVAKLYQQLRQTVVVILPSPGDVEKFLADLQFFLPVDDNNLLMFPAYNIQPFKLLAYHNETAALRLNALYRMTQTDQPMIIVTTVSAVLHRLIPRPELIDFSELVMVNEALDRDSLVSRMISGGYVRTAIVEEPGDFSIRGGILDIFSPLYPDPLRIELFGDIVESIRLFSASTQRKVNAISEAVILPAREAILRKENLNQVISRIRKQAAELNLPVTEVRGIIDRIRDEGIFPGMESLLPLVYQEPGSFFDYIPEKSRVVMIEPQDLAAAAQAVENQTHDNFEKAREEKRLLVEPDKLFLKWADVLGQIQSTHPVYMKMLPVAVPESVNSADSVPLGIEDNAGVVAELQSPLDKDRLLLPLTDWIQAHKKRGCAVLIVCSGKSQADRLCSLLRPYQISPAVLEGVPDLVRGRGLVYICLGRLSSGFVWQDESLAVITEDEIFGKKSHRRKKRGQTARAELLALEDLKKGDLVVHVDHGIGQYQGLSKLKLNGVTNDYLLILYKDEDKLYLPVDRMGMVQKYIGVNDLLPILDKMGGKAWIKAKGKARKEVEKIAGELLKLYSARRVKQGHAFGAADSYFKDFEAAFPYEETADQLHTIDEVLNDMEAAAPMDRLVCGDVGYGKTEVALRASFKAISDSKQVAVLVPTTVLAEQHHKTFSQRFERYPVRIACLNRFRSSKEQRAIIDEMKSGAIDIVIGTHRLLQKDIEFKDLGLIVLDEEQRFGVKHKEKLKQLRTTVDVLALTATPIPRTLHMSLMGIRDISIISTPPEERHAIITYISEFNHGIITDAIQKEMARRGQVFFIHNNIHSINRMAELVQKLVPEARIGVAHGRLSEDELEKVMISFVNQEMDVLVCTTIVESGLDIPAANTIIINRADRFGLAQIYQLRGRVGRADEQAYAYLFIPEETNLGKDAQKRLKVLMEHSDLGSGFQIAMSDLQIRGGGSALGVSQSGHIAAVGYDMFLQLMENAVAELKGEPVVDALEPEINIPLSAFIPESYIPDIDQRLSVYRRLARMTEVSEISGIKEELTDRYGVLPDEAANLLLKIMLKILSVKGGVKRLDISGRYVSLHFSEIHQKHPFGLVDMVSANPKKFQFTVDHVLKVLLPQTGIQGVVMEIRNILKEIAMHVNS
ncbi:MAG: transcription-repair coupling factor [Desulfobacteraceae bacterium]|nr:MAG: transcription-repair coupling factor [Desulfobacteraceae bacterium]